MYEELNPGTYEANLVDWSMEMVERLNQPKIVLQFEFGHAGKVYKMKFDSFVFRKDGDVNKKTIDTLRICGFKGANISDLLREDIAALNTKQMYTIDVIKDGEYWRIEWINLPGGGSMDKATAKKTLAGVDFSRINGALMQAGNGQTKPKVKNYAPNSDDSEIPF